MQFLNFKGSLNLSGLIEKKELKKLDQTSKKKKNSPVDVFCSQCPIKQQIADINLHNLARAVSTKTRL
jgi:hypothetical protein